MTRAKKAEPMQPAASTDVQEVTMPPAGTPVATLVSSPETLEALAARAERLKNELDATLAELVAQRRVLDEHLAKLGYTDNGIFRSVDGVGRPKQTSRGARAVRKGESRNPCRVCLARGKTVYDHDARTHRRENLARIAKGVKPRR